MSQKNFRLFVGVDEKRFSFTVIDTKNEEDPKIVHTNQTQVTGVIENKITDPNEVYDILRTNTFEIERKLNCVFKEAILILDSLNSPLESASIVAINKLTNGLENYALSDKEGKYELNLKENNGYKIQVSSIGLITINDTIETKESNFLKDYVLRANVVLDEVIVTMPVIVRGDTLIYNADSFKNGSERKLEDIIDKLPGVEINDNGQIEVEGKVVNNLIFMA